MEQFDALTEKYADSPKKALTQVSEIDPPPSIHPTMFYHYYEQLYTYAVVLCFVLVLRMPSCSYRSGSSQSRNTFEDKRS